MSTGDWAWKTDFGGSTDPTFEMTLTSNLCTSCWSSPCQCCTCPCKKHHFCAVAWSRGKPNLCPICVGKGNLPQDFYNQLGVSTNAGGRITCKACLGSGILWG